MNDHVRFEPSGCDGMDGVSEVAVFPDRLELRASNNVTVVKLSEIVRWRRPIAVRKLLAKAGLRPRYLVVGERDWCRSPRERFVRFYTDPPITIRVPDHEGMDYSESFIPRIGSVLATGGYCTHDLA